MFVSQLEGIDVFVSQLEGIDVFVSQLEGIDVFVSQSHHAAVGYRCVCPDNGSQPICPRNDLS